MKPKNMTNKQLAVNLEATVPFLMKEARNLTDAEEILRVAAARLRKLTDMTCEFALPNGGCRAVNKQTYKLSGLQQRLKVAKDALTKSPCGVIFQLGIKDDDGNFYDGVVIKFDEAEALKMPRVCQGDKFIVVPYKDFASTI